MILREKSDRLLLFQNLLLDIIFCEQNGGWIFKGNWLLMKNRQSKTEMWYVVIKTFILVT